MVRQNGNTAKLKRFRQNIEQETRARRDFYNTANPYGEHDPLQDAVSYEVDPEIAGTVWDTLDQDGPDISQGVTAENQNNIDINKSNLSTTSDYKGTKHTWLKDTWNKFNEVLYENLVNKDFGNLERSKDDEEAVLFLKNYNDCVKQRKQLQDQLKNYDPNSSEYLSTLYKIKDVERTLLQYDDWVMRVGKNNPIIANQMFDINKLNSYRDQLDVADAGASLKYGTDQNFNSLADELKKININPVDNIKGLFSPKEWLRTLGGMWNIVEKGTLTAAGYGLQVANMAADQLGLGKLFGQEDMFDDLKQEYVQHGGYFGSARGENAQKQYEDNLRKMYKGFSSYNTKDNKNAQYHLLGEFTDDAKTDKWLNDIKNERKEAEVDLEDHIDALRNGRVKWFDRTYQMFNPKDISREYTNRYNKIEQDGFDYLSSDWLYSIPEVASTVSLFDNQAKGMVATNAFALLMGGARKVAGKITSEAFKKLLGLATDYGLTSSGIVNTFSAATGVAVAQQSRKAETGMESIGAQQQRLLEHLVKLSENGNFDYNQTLNDIKNRLQSTYKINPNGMDEQQLLQAAIAYRMDDIVPGLEQLRPGIQRLINANNALAVTEYLQTLPFLHFEGSFMKNTINAAKNRVKDASLDAYQLTKTGLGKIPGSSKIASAASKINPMNTERGQAIMARVSNFNKRIADKFTSKDMPFVRTKKGRVLQYLGKKAKDYGKIAAYESVLEGGEEGVQQILTSDYVSGKYDKDSYAPTSYLDLHSFSEIPNLYANAFLDYLGLNTDDPYNADKELRNAMNIGFISSLMFSGVLKGGSNVMSNAFNNPSNNNLRNLVQQIKADNLVNKLVANYGKAAQDADHVNLFIERFLRNETSVVPILRSLNDMKKAVTEDGVITEADIENDKKLAINTYNILNSKYINEKIKEDGVDRNSDEFKQIVLDGATALTDYQMSLELVEGQNEQLNNVRNELKERVKLLLSDETSNREKKELRDKNPGFAAVIEELKEKATKYNKRRGELFGSVKKLALNVPTDGIDSAIEYVYNKILTGGYNVLIDHFGYDSNYIDQLIKDKKSLKEHPEKTIEVLGKYKAFVSRLQNEDYEKYKKSDSEFVSNAVDYILNSAIAKQEQKVSEMLGDHEWLLKTIQKETGLDINTDRLQGIVGTHSEHSEEMGKKYRSTENEQQSNFLAEVDSYIKNLFEDSFGENSTFGEEFNKLITSLSINRAALFNQHNVAKMYTGSNVSSEEVKNAIWGRDKEGTVIDRESKESGEKIKQLFTPAKQDDDIEKLNRQNLLKSILEISETGNWKAIKELAKQHAKRKRIARRQWREEALTQSEGQGQENNPQNPTDAETGSDSSKESQKSSGNGNEIKEGQSSKRLGKEITGGRTIKDDEQLAEEAKQKAKKKKKENEKKKEELSTQEKSPLQEPEKTPTSANKESSQEGKASPKPEDEGATFSPEQLGIDEPKRSKKQYEAPVITIQTKRQYVSPEIEHKDFSEQIADQRSADVIRKNLERLQDQIDMDLQDFYKLQKIADHELNEQLLEIVSYHNSIRNKLTDILGTEFNNWYITTEQLSELCDYFENAEKQLTENYKRFAKLRDSFEENKKDTFDKLEDVPIDGKPHRLSNDNRTLKLKEILGIEYEWWSKPWKSDKKRINETVRIYISGKKDRGYYELVINTDESTGEIIKQVSVHFKPVGSTVDEMKQQFTEEEKELLFAALHMNIPTGWTVTTYGELSKGGVHGLNRFGEQFGYEKVGEHSGKMKDTGEKIDIPIYRKPNDSVDVGGDIGQIDDPTVVSGTFIDSTDNHKDENEEISEELAKLDIGEQEQGIAIMTQLDLSELEYDEETDRFKDKDGNLLDEETSKKIEEELTLLGLIDVAVISQEELPDGTKKTVIQKRVMADDQTIRDLVSSTMFYQPDATDPMVLKIGDQTVTFDKPIKPGIELAQRLTEKGFLENANKYFIVTESNAASTAENRYDAATVVMCIETEDAVYLTALRNLGVTKSEYKKGKNTNEDDLYLKYWKLSNVDDQGFVTTDNENNLSQWLEMCNINIERCAEVYEELFGKVPQTDTDVQRRTVYKAALMGVAKKIAFNYYKSVHPSAREGVTESENYYKEFERWWYQGPLKGSKEEGLDDANYKQAVQTCVDRARALLLKPGKKGLTAKQIQQQISALRSFRNQIISNYAKLAGVDMENPTSKFPTTPIKGVVPTSVTSSNGKIDNMKDEVGSPVYRGVLETSEKIPTIDDYISALQNDQLLFGIGTGLFSNSPYAIVQLNGEDQVLFNGRGLSGKIFMMVKNDRTGVSVPIMLAEEKFDSQKSNDGSLYYKGDIRLTLELDEYGKARAIDQNRELSNQETVKRQPSAAEVLLYMLCGKADVGVTDPETVQQITEFFIHNGEKTLLRNQKKLQKNPISAMMSKQLCFNAEKQTLEIAVPTGEYTKSGVVLYTTKEYSVDEIFGDTEESKQLRLILVQRIAEQMHWNTDKEYLRSSFSAMKQDSAISKFLNYLLQKKQQAGDFEGMSEEQIANQRISILGCDQLSFRIGDFFEQVNGKMKSRSDGVSVMAWMLSEKKLKTDVSEKLFKDPFVFAEGVGVSNKPTEPRPQNNTKQKITRKADEEKPFRFVQMTKTSEGFNVLTQRLYGSEFTREDNDSQFSRSIGDVRQKSDGWGEHNGIVYYKQSIDGRIGDNITFSFNVLSLKDIPEEVKKNIESEIKACLQGKPSSISHVDYSKFESVAESYKTLLNNLPKIANGFAFSNNNIETGGVYPFFNQKSYNALIGKKNDWKKSLTPSGQVATTKEERDKLADQYKQEDKIGINDVKYEVVDRFIATPQVGMSNEEFYDDFCKKYKAATGIDLSGLPEERRKFCGKMNVKSSISMIEIGKNENGEYGFKLTPYATNNFNKLFSTYLAKQNRMHVSGVFSNKKSKMPFNEKKARHELHRLLGIDDANVIVTDAILMSMQDQEIFGLTDVCVDALAGGLTGYIMLSERGGVGVAYHEAWHYVNLLMHDSSIRNAIYKDYLKSHKGLNKKGVKIKDIEEALAEEFRMWMETNMDHSIKGRIKLAFQNIKYFLNTVILHRNKYRSVFRSIQKGKYRNLKINRQSVEDFKSQYPKGAFLNYRLPGMSSKDTEQIDVDTYRQYYDAARSITNNFILTFDIKSIDDILKFAQSSGTSNVFKQVVDSVQEIIDNLDEDTDSMQIHVLKTLQRNPSQLKKLFVESLMELGITAKVIDRIQKKDPKKSSGEEISSNETQKEAELEDSIKKEDMADNYWDSVDLTVSKKQNAAGETKLFLRAIPVVKRDFDSDTGFTEEFDDYGVQKLYMFDEAWNKMSNELAMCQSFADKNEDGTYKASSILGTVQRNATSDAFWYSLNQKLNELEEDSFSTHTTIKSQIFTTFCSSKNPVHFIELRDAVIKKSYNPDEDFGDMSDDIENKKRVVFETDVQQKSRERMWSEVGDEAFIITRSVPRRWSQILASNGLATYNQETQQTELNQKYVQKITNKWNELETLMSAKKITEDQAYDKLFGSIESGNVIEKLTDLFNLMGIAADKQIADAFVLAMSRDVEGVHDSALKRYKGVQKMINQNGAGNFAAIIKNLNDSIGKPYLDKIGRQKSQKQFDEVFNNCPSNSQIAKLAIIFNNYHPNLQDYSVKGPNGETYYPIGQNNSLSSAIRQLNANENGEIEQLEESSYTGQNSVILNAAKKVNSNDPSTELKINVFVGMKDANAQKGSDFLEISALDDYLSKLFMTENDSIIFPTMADKKTWYSLSSKNIELCHDIILKAIPSEIDTDVKKRLCKELLDKYNKRHNTDVELYRSEILKLFDAITTLRTLGSEYEHLKEQLTDEEIKKVEDAQKLLEKIGESLCITTEKEVDEFYSDLIYMSDDAYGESRSQIKSLGLNIGRLSDSTLTLFSNYFINELNSLIEYYSRENVQVLIKNPNKAKTNFHGKIKNGRMLFGGNGGLFRYFYDIETIGSKKHKINLNQKLEALWITQQQIEKGGVKDEESTNNLYQNVTTEDIAERGADDKLLDLDGFELVRAELNRLKREYTATLINESLPTQSLKNQINNFLMNHIDEEVRNVCNPTSQLYLGDFNEQRMAIPHSLPRQFMQKWRDRFTKAGLQSDLPYGAMNDQDSYNIFVSCIGNYVLNSMISTIEVEKIFTGDPALYKYKKNSSDPTTKVQFTQKIQVGESSVEIKVKADVTNLYDMFSYKIKRLGGTESPGQEVRTDFSEKEKKLLGNDIACTQYTVLDVEDVEMPSAYYEHTYTMFEKQLFVDSIRMSLNNYDKIPQWFTTAVEKYTKTLDPVENKDEIEVLSDLKNIERHIDYIYDNDSFYEILKSTFYGRKGKDAAKEIDLIKSMLDQQMDPYEKINVCDAQVFVRPAMYRRIKIGLGEWTTEEDTNGYSDEKAYQLIENGILDGEHVDPSSWMSNPELYKLVKKFQTNILKMSYFKNGTDTTGAQDAAYNNAVYNKMALMPLFKYHASTEVGKLLYERMNRPGHELDMIAFKSAVKVGAKSNTLTPVENPKLKTDESGRVTNNEDIKQALGKLSAKINNSSDLHIDYDSDTVVSTTDQENTLPINVQTIKDLRLQLNTHAHEKTERSMGSQMFKLAFSNIVEDATYGHSSGNIRTGAQIKRDIMDTISHLTRKGVITLRDRFYTTKEVEYEVEITDEKGNKVKEKRIREERFVDKEKVSDFIQDIAESQGLGIVAEDILNRGGVVESLTSRGVFEQALCKLIEREVVEIRTNGGTAVQQSSFGFAGSPMVADQQFGQYHTYNNGEELKWITEDNSMEVLLSMNFFKPVVPKEFQTDYTTMREWLIEHDVIKGIKKDGTQSKPKPFGVGYRIPTQGMSSMFSFVVADVLPEIAGDTIIVPREFTAQTGSDFDIDKLYLATFEYENGERATLKYIEKEVTDSGGKTTKEKRIDTKNSSAGAFGNRLLQDYIDLITDRRNFANARASIDVITNIIQDDILPYIRTSKKGYLSGGSQLLPSFQTNRKLEFSVGKTGIGPFALSVTNMALTQYSHLSLEYGINEYGFGHMDQIYGKDGLRIADWLSAMVNAHVDVAKDAYVFDLNINSNTYNHVSFWLRAGMGQSTFFVLANPAVKQYIQNIQGASGMYKTYTQESEKVFGKKEEVALKKQYSAVLDDIKQAVKEILEDENSKTFTDNHQYNVTSDILKNVISYYSYFAADTKEREKMKQVKDRVENKRIVFNTDVTRAKNSCMNYYSSNPRERLDALVFSLYCLEAYKDSKPYADAMYDLIQSSKIDTKKFGNNVSSHINYENNLNQCKYGSTLFTLNLPENKKKKLYSLLPVRHDKNGKVLPVQQEDISKLALHHYFTETFLQEKFDKTQKYMRMLLWNQSYKASSLYRDLFVSVAANVFGENISETLEFDDDTKQFVDGSITGYKKVFSDDTVQAFGDGIENIMRYLSLMTFGTQYYEELKKKDANILDLTEGGDVNAVRERMRNLMFGEYVYDKNGDAVQTKKSIFTRLSELQTKLRTHPEQYDSSLVDEDGNIMNEMLIFLTPLMPSEKYPIGRIICSQPTTFVKGERKSRLTAAFAELLYNDNEEISTLAKDLAFYSYHSQYDQGGKNSFFEFVLPEVRKQYDLSLKKSMDLISQNDKQNRIKVLQMLQSEKLPEDVSFEIHLSKAAQSIIDILCRNYWYDNTIIKPCKPSTKAENDYFQKSSYTPAPISYKDFGTGKVANFPQYVCSSRESDQLYIKLQSKGVTVLYRKAGEITQTRTTDDGKTKKGNVMAVFVPVQKAGLHVNRANQFEFSTSYDVSSIYTANHMYKTFAEDVVRKAVEDYVQKSNDWIHKQLEDKKNKDKELWDIELVWTVPQPKSFVQDNFDIYENEDSFYDAAKKGFHIGREYTTFKDSADKTVFEVSKRSTVLIDVSNGDSEFGWNISKHKKDETDEQKGFVYGEDHAVLFDIQNPISDQLLNKIDEIITNRKENNISLMLTTRYRDYQILKYLKETKQENGKTIYQNALDNTINILRQNVVKASTVQEAEKVANKTRESLEKPTSEMSRREKTMYYEFLNKTVSDYINEKIRPLVEVLVDKYSIDSVNIAAVNGRLSLSRVGAMLYRDVLAKKSVKVDTTFGLQSYYNSTGSIAVAKSQMDSAISQVKSIIKDSKFGTPTEDQQNQEEKSDSELQKKIDESQKRLENKVKQQVAETESKAKQSADKNQQDEDGITFSSDQLFGGATNTQQIAKDDESDGITFDASALLGEAENDGNSENSKC